MNTISSTTNLNVRVDSALKEKSDTLFKDLGLNMSTAINMFLIKCVKTSSIPFKIEEENPNERLINALKETEYICEHPNEYKSYDSVDKLFKDLDND